MREDGAPSGWCVWTGTCREERNAGHFTCDRADNCEERVRKDQAKLTAREACKAAGHPNKYKNPNWTPNVPWDSPSEYHCPVCGGIGNGK